VTVGSNPTAIAITPDGATAYVAVYAGGAVTPVGLASGTPRTRSKSRRGPARSPSHPTGRPHMSQACWRPRACEVCRQPRPAWSPQSACHPASDTQTLESTGTTR
jgi:hypothetical protein